MGLAAVTLDDKYTIDTGRVYLTGTQALVRLPLMQRQRDLAAGLNTACFISGYRGSPLGGFDQALGNARRFIERNHIRFQPGINEEMAATAVWGSQQIGLFPGAKYDGVFGMWYGKGPGVDRSGDPLKHANSAGTAPHGGVLAVAGDDHTCKSSTLAHQSEFAFIDAAIPLLNPAGIEDIIDLGIYGWAMSRYSGCWVAFKTVAETMDSSASVSVDPGRIAVVLPEDVEMPPGGLNIRWPDTPLDQEYRLHRYKLAAAIAFARANGLDGIVIDSPTPRFGIVTTGKSYLDVRQALDDLGIGEREAGEIGLRRGWPRWRRRGGSTAAASCRFSARPISARAVPTTPRRAYRRGAARWPASAVITCRNSWTARRRPLRRWAAKACRGSGRRRLPRRSMSSPISVTAPTRIPAFWRSARRSRPVST